MPDRLATYDMRGVLVKIAPARPQDRLVEQRALGRAEGTVVASSKSASETHERTPARPRSFERERELSPLKAVSTAVGP
jgi:hypothetical protein